MCVTGPCPGRGHWKSDGHAGVRDCYTRRDYSTVPTASDSDSESESLPVTVAAGSRPAAESDSESVADRTCQSR